METTTIATSKNSTQIVSTARASGEFPENIDCNSKLRKNSVEQDTATNSVSTDGGNAPVPNFRVEGSGAGDSSITVGVGSLSTSSVLTSSLVKSDNECASLVDSSLGTETETEEPGVTTASTNGDLLSSLQSSEPDEMPLSLVSWYSEPGDCVSACSNSACCEQQVNGDDSQCGASEISDLIVKSDHSQATPTAAAPNVDFLSDEKENKTPGSVAAATSSSTLNSHIPCRTAKKEHKTKEKDQSSDNSQTAPKKIPKQKSASASSATKPSVDSHGSTESKSRRRDKMHVQVFEQKSETTNHNSITSVSGQSLLEQGGGSKEGARERRHRERERVECPRCSRRSKSGSTPPVAAVNKSATRRTHHHHSESAQMQNGGTHQNSTPVNRELKKPIKSILKSEARSGGSGGSGSGSEKQSSMDSLGSNSGVVMSRSDAGPRTKFYINSNDSISYPEDRMVSKLKRIEKYATVRVKKGRAGGGPAKQASQEDVNSSPDEGARQRTNSETGDGLSADFIPDLMTKSMSFLEKSSSPFSQSHQSRGILPNSSGPSSLKRQGSLKNRKPSPGWEPGATRTSALRLLKMQENKAKTGSFSSGIGSSHAGTSGSAHSGSGESIHGTPPTALRHHHHVSRSATANSSSFAGANSAAATAAYKERGHSNSSAKVFTKLSSALGQTASSSMKRLKQEKSVQTDNVTVVDSITSPVLQAAASKVSSVSNSPEPLLYSNIEAASAAAAMAATASTLDQQTEQIKQLENLVRLYKSSALRFQKEFERTDRTNYELKKQLQENQMESNEMLEFLQAEKSTLAESLVEVETECKKLTRELESVVKESQSRCSSLVRLSEQHKQESLKAQTLLTRLERATSERIAAQATQLTQGREAVRGIKAQILCLIDTLMRTYKVSQERLAMDGFAESTAGPSKDETELRCTLLLPLIRSLSRAFDAFKIQVKNNEMLANRVNQNSHAPTAIPTSNGSMAASANTDTTGKPASAPENGLDSNTSLQKLNQAIIEREKAETVGLDSITTTTCSKGTTTSADDLSLHDDLEQLQVALRKLCTVIRIIVIHCDQKVSNVASDILQLSTTEENNDKYYERRKGHREVELTTNENSTPTSSPSPLKRDKLHLLSNSKNNVHMAATPNATGNKRPPDDTSSGGNGEEDGGFDGQGDGVGMDSLGPPPPKSQKVVFEPVRLIGISNQEEMDIKVLQFQHKKLRQRLEYRQRQEQELLDRVQQLETRQTQDDAVLNVMNRYWNQLNEDIRILLQRFDTETSDESENKNESEATTSFLTQLSTWDKEELDDKLAHRVQVSTRAVAKIIQAFDRLQQRNEKISKALNGELEDNQTLDDVVRQANVNLESENQKLQALNTSLHERYHIMSLKMKEFADKLSSEETKADELKNRVDDLNWEISKLVAQNEKLTNVTNEVQEKYKKLQAWNLNEERRQQLITSSSWDIIPGRIDIPDPELHEMQLEVEEAKEMASMRLQELERAMQLHKETVRELETLRMQIRHLPESVIVETTEYKCLQSKFSVIYNDTALLRQSFEEAKQNYYAMKNFHLKRIEELESEELLGQKKLRAEMIQLEDLLGQVRKEYDMLRIEYEQNLAANEQTGPINREMRHLITSLQNHNQQLKGDSARYRRKYKDLSNECTRIKRIKDQIEMRLASSNDSTRLRYVSGNDSIKEEDSPSSSSCLQRQESSSPNSNRNHEDSSNDDQETVIVKMEKTHNDIDNKKEVREAIKKIESGRRSDAELIKELRSQLKKTQNEQRELKLLLDMYKGSSKDQRDRVQLLASEKKTRMEIEELRQQVKKLQENKREDRKKLADEDALKKIKLLEDQVHCLQKQVTGQKLEEETLLNDMEVTGQAFEDMQEQNSRLIQQLREKDDANFKLMSDRIKSAHLHKLALEERGLLHDQISSLTKQVDAQNQVIRKLEEKEKVLLNTMTVIDQEGRMRLNASDMNKRKAIEAAQSAADLKLHLEKYHSQMKEAQQTVAEKTSALEQEAYKTKRLQEEIVLLKRRVERLNKIEMAGNSDAVMLEEIREYKETLTCPSCKVKRKDAVLSKCFHVFCFDCLRTRYETRQRKCPKCNAGFGANDYHRLYLS